MNENRHAVAYTHISDGIARSQLEEPMRITLSVIKADIGSIGAHIAPSRRLPEMA